MDEAVELSSGDEDSYIDLCESDEADEGEAYLS